MKIRHISKGKQIDVGKPQPQNLQVVDRKVWPFQNRSRNCSHTGWLTDSIIDYFRSTKRRMESSLLKSPTTWRHSGARVLSGTNMEGEQRDDQVEGGTYTERMVVKVWFLLVSS